MRTLFASPWATQTKSKNKISNSQHISSDPANSLLSSKLYCEEFKKRKFVSIEEGLKKLKDYNVAGEDNLIYATANGLPAWHTLNLRANYKVNKNIDLQIAIENIADKNYRVFGSGISASGRNVLFAIKGNF